MKCHAQMVQLLCMDILHTHRSFPLLTTYLLHAMSSADVGSAFEMLVGLQFPEGSKDHKIGGRSDTVEYRLGIEPKECASCR